MARAARKSSKRKRKRPAPRAKRKRRSSPVKPNREDVHASKALAVLVDRSSLFTAVMNRIRGRLDESISESGAAIDFVDADVIRASDVSSGSPVLGAPALGNAAPLPE